MRIKNILALKNGYFKAVNMDSCNRNAKIHAILECFTEDATIIDSLGKKYWGKTGVEEFYSSPASPVLSEGFKAVPDEDTVTTNGTNLVAVEIILSNLKNTIKVGDWFLMDGDLIKSLRIYKADIVE